MGLAYQAMESKSISRPRLIPRNTDNSVPWNSIALSCEIQANRSFRFWVVSDRTMSRDNLTIIRGSVLVPMANDHKHDTASNSHFTRFHKRVTTIVIVGFACSGECAAE